MGVTDTAAARAEADRIYKEDFQGKQEIMLPVAAKIYDKVLSLQGYTLSIGQCMALARVFADTEITLKTLHLDNCGVDDDECAVVLEALVPSTEFKTFYYKNNMFGEESLAVM